MSYPAVALRKPQGPDSSIIWTNRTLNFEVEELFPDNKFEGLWRSKGGSIYKYEAGEFICIFVHSQEFKGWLNKAAIRNVRNEGGRWYGQQAFRNAMTGELSCWVDIRIEVERNKITKYFPANIPPGHILVYGPVEYYYRIFQGS